ncbi:penicillin acylase family protein [Flectobacillus rivi]|uniref:Penicillin acylase family protein n=1 Tax=Flectobacillus rivi TaxID=2984209 RepID=A0ABT6Z6N5_9BACT|nr:penicillin acylase family protein [Flectobacillus rivi]MDI9876797.1 penicillin acylase family protein [Flectobacillus rivi]
MRLIKRILMGLLIVVVLLGLGVFVWLKSKVANHDQEINLQGLSQPVEVLWDDFGIPHIYAQTEEDAYFALGYVHAQERLFQMEALRRLADGRLSEVFGDMALESDKFFRSLGFRKYAEQTIAQYPKNEGYVKAASAYVNGVNAFIENGDTPVEFELLKIPKTPFSNLDLHIIQGYMGFSFADAFRTDPLMTYIQQSLGEEYTKDLVTTWATNAEKIPVTKGNEKEIALRKGAESVQNLLALGNQVLELQKAAPFPTFHGSNSWVVAGSKTKSKGVIFSNDTHIAFSQPSVFFEANLVYPNQNFYGNFIAGIPMAVIGHNDKAGWGLTMFENDDVDFYREKINPANANQVWFKDHWEDLTIRKEVIKVKGKPDVAVQYRSSRHGVLINEFDKKFVHEKSPVALWWVLTQFPDRSLKVFYDLAHATDVKQAEAAASMIHFPGLNVMYGDAKGNIAWWASAKLPKRPAHVKPYMILDGASGKDEIEGWLDFSQNPHAVNPASGFVYSANNQPEDMGTGLVAGYYVAPDRATRIKQLLNTPKNDWTTEDMHQMITEHKSAMAPTVIQSIAPIIKSTGHTELLTWDGTHDLEDIEPTIYYRFLYRMYEATFKDELGAEGFKAFINSQTMKRSLQNFIVNDTSKWWDNKDTKNIETRTQIIQSALNQAYTDLAAQLGTDKKAWHWQKVHTLEHVHPVGRQKPLNKLFNVGPLPAMAGKEVINNLDFPLDSSGYYKVSYGPALRRVIDFSKPFEGQSINPTGQSGYFMSKHYDDQARMYVEGKFRGELIRKEDVEKVKSGKQVLKPNQ